MESKIYHGNIKPSDFIKPLTAHFNRGNYKVQQVGTGNQVSIQIASKTYAKSGGQTALTVNIQKVEDGVSIQIGKQAWLQVAASIGFTAISTIRNPFNILSRLDDLAQDIESLQLSTEVWEVIDSIAKSIGTGHELSERLKRYVCGYCNTANPTGEPRCIACGAPLGDEQPQTCRFCGYIIKKNEKICPNCKKAL